MTKYIVKFTKSDKVKFVSHLDTVRVFGRTMRRMNAPLSYSQGFNPHPIMTFAHPMGVGISSSGEYVEIGMEKSISPKELVLGLNKAFPPGFKAVGAKVNEKKSPFKELSYAEYEIRLIGNIKQNPADIMKLHEIVMDKKTKSGIKETDIKPMIKEIEVKKQTDKETYFKAVLKCGAENLKPELMLEAMKKYIGIAPEDFNIHRTALLDGNGKALVEF